ncbi:hypothetical protein [uncultured Tenacibaculum sp.]|uniref:hypothetical protein n=1 Tax=uncultured Tenacibaculum sp. TaxID=174713 RepID=UPI0026173AA1|nr:hypothetical protein [uncultured Tenacibaculum sp.]
MMAGKHIKFLIFITIFITNCKTNVNTEKSIRLIVNNYIKEELNSVNEHSIICVSKDSAINYELIRIAKYANLLDVNSPIPNHFESIEGNKIVYYTQNNNTKKELDSIKKLLDENSYYRKDSIYYSSNYPEWIVLRNKNSKKQVIVKNMWYQPIDSIIKKYKKEIE